MAQAQIDRQIDIKAPVARVWRALTDHVEFGTWFGVKLTSPFVVGQPCRGHITAPGYEKHTLSLTPQAMEPQTLFSYTWHPYAVELAHDYSAEAPTLVTFRLEPIGEGTRLWLVESGFENIPGTRRAEAFRMNEGGWSAQMKNVERHVTGQS